MNKVILLLLLSIHSIHAATVTAYCACTKCCGVMGGTGTTASGRQATQGITVAASRSIPLGTRVHIEGVGVRIVQDRLARRFDGRVDVFFTSHSDAQRFGKRTLKVRVMK